MVVHKRHDQGLLMVINGDCVKSFKKKEFSFFIIVFLSYTDRICEAVQASGPVDPTGRVQMAEETLSQSAPDLQRFVQTARHHR